MKLYVDAVELASLIGRSKSTASRRIREMNKELKEEGYFVEQGIVPTQKVIEKYPHLEICFKTN